jgi:hypothetical protein
MMRSSEKNYSYSSHDDVNETHITFNFEGGAGGYYNDIEEAINEKLYDVNDSYNVNDYD